MKASYKQVLKNLADLVAKPHDKIPNVEAAAKRTDAYLAKAVASAKELLKQYRIKK